MKTRKRLSQFLILLFTVVGLIDQSAIARPGSTSIWSELTTGLEIMLPGISVGVILDHLVVYTRGYGHRPDCLACRLAF